MKYSVRYKKVFDKDHRIVDISSVTTENKDVEYYSIGTHTPMIAALGEKNQHYFRVKQVPGTCFTLIDYPQPEDYRPEKFKEKE